MTITVNAESESYTEESLSIRAILERKHWSFPLIIARVNGELVPRDVYDTRRVVEGDALELYHLISGG